GALDPVIRVALVLVLQLALALQSERVALDLNLDVLRLDFRQLRLERDAFRILEDVDQRRPGRHHRLLVLAAAATVGGVEGAKELVLQRDQVAKGIVTTNDGHTSAPFKQKKILWDAGGAFPRSRRRPQRKTARGRVKARVPVG